MIRILQAEAICFIWYLSVWSTCGIRGTVVPLTKIALGLHLSKSVRFQGGIVVVNDVRNALVRIINETQIIMSAAEEGRQDVINRALGRIEDIIDGIKTSNNVTPNC